MGTTARSARFSSRSARAAGCTLMAAAAELLAGATKRHVRRGALDGLQVELGGAQRLQVHRPSCSWPVSGTAAESHHSCGVACADVSSEVCWADRVRVVAPRSVPGRAGRHGHW